MYRRLATVKRALEQRGLRTSGVAMPEPIKTLADVVEPATFGQRIRTHRYNQQTPLDQLVDEITPESDTAREFAALVDRMDRAQMRVWLVRWRDNQAGIEPASGALRRLAVIGLQALDYLERNERPPDAWLAQQRALLETFRKPQAELRIAIVPSIEKLLAAY